MLFEILLHFPSRPIKTGEIEFIIESYFEKGERQKTHHESIFSAGPTGVLAGTNRENSGALFIANDAA